MFFIDNENKAVQVDATYDADNQCAVFYTDHFSNWFVDVIPASTEGGSDMDLGPILGIVIGGLVAAVAVVFFLMKSGKLGGSKGST